MAVWLCQFPGMMGASPASRQPWGYTFPCLLSPSPIVWEYSHVQHHNVVAQKGLPICLPPPVCMSTVSHHHFTVAQIRIYLLGSSPSNGIESNACSHAFCVSAVAHNIVHMPVSLHALSQCCHVVTLASATSQCHHVAAWASVFRHVMFQHQHVMAQHSCLCACHFTRLPSSPSGIVAMPVCVPVMS